MRVRCFVGANDYHATKINASDLTSPHDTELSDPNTALELNYQWRRLLPQFLRTLFVRDLYTGTETEIDNAIQNVNLLIDGLYQAQSGGATITKLAAKVRRSTNQAFPSGVIGAIAFETVDYEYGEFWDISDPTKLIVPVGGDGLYQVSGNFELAHTGSARNRAAFLYKNGTVVVVRDIAGSALRSGYTISADLELVAGDELTMHAYSVGETATVDADAVNPTFSIVRLYE